MAEQRLEEIRKIRLQKVEDLRKLGVNPYPSKVKGVYEPISAVRDQVGVTKAVVGRVMGWRSHGNIIFARQIPIPQQAKK